MRPILKGSADQSVVIRIVDSADGTPETGVVYNTSGIDLWYRREGAAKTSITEASLSALTDAHADGGILHIGDGYYRLDLPDAAVASGANGVVVGGTVTGMVVLGAYLPLVDYNPYDATRLGLAALPNAAAEASGGLPTLSAAQASNGTINANVHRWLTGTPNALQSGRVDSYLGAAAAGVIAAATFAANALDAVWSTTTRLLTAGTNIVLAKGTGVTGFNDLDATAVASATQTGLTAQGYTPTRAGYLDTLNGLVQAIWDAATSALTTVGSIGKLLVDNVNAAIGSRAAAADLATVAGYLDTEIGDIQARLPAALVAGRIDASVGAMAANVMTAAAAAADLTTEWQSGLSTLDAAGVRAALGLATANMDTQLDALPTNAELATALGAADDAVLAAIAALVIPTAAQNAAALMDLADGVETGLTPRQAMRLMVASLAGKLSGAATTTIVIRNAVADSKNRITATVDADGNRSAITVDLT